MRPRPRGAGRAPSSTTAEVELGGERIPADRLVMIWSAAAGAAGIVLALYPVAWRYQSYKEEHPNGWTQFV